MMLKAANKKEKLHLMRGGGGIKKLVIHQTLFVKFYVTSVVFVLTNQISEELMILEQHGVVQEKGQPDSTFFKVQQISEQFSWFHDSVSTQSGNYGHAEPFSECKQLRLRLSRYSCTMNWQKRSPG